MADSNFRGPINAMGSLAVNAATTAVEPLDGPSLFYQAAGFPDLRSAPFAKDGFRPGQQPAFVGNPLILLDNIPQKLATNVIATGQVMTAALAVTLVTTQAAGLASAANVAVGVPIVPLGTTVATFAAIAIDFGFTTGTTASNSSTVVVVDSTLFRQGQWIVVGGAANASASRSLITQVMSSPNATTIQVSPVAATTLANVPIGQANLWGSSLLPSATPFGPSAAVPNAHAFGGAIEAGLARVYNPREMLGRTIQIQASTALVSAYSAIVSGWDAWGVPMTENLTAAAGVTTFMGKKAFKYISSITSGTTNAATQLVSVGLGEAFGFPVRMDAWEYLHISWNGATSTNNNGFVAGVTSPATSSTGDVRGTIMVSTAIITSSFAGAIATSFSIATTNGTGRLTVVASIPPMQTVLGTPINQTPMFGVAQSTATT